MANRYRLTIDGKTIATGPARMIAPYLARNPRATARKVDNP